MSRYIQFINNGDSCETFFPLKELILFVFGKCRLKKKRKILVENSLENILVAHLENCVSLSLGRKTH